VTYIDRNGATSEIRLERLAARAFCHEHDHLWGKLFIDRILTHRLTSDHRLPTDTTPTRLLPLNETFQGVEISSQQRDAATGWFSDDTRRARHKQLAALLKDVSPASTLPSPL
jgi:hypothetical protein